MGKALAGAAALEDHDFVYIHVEAPDECGHRGEAENKTKTLDRVLRYAGAAAWGDKKERL